MFDAPATTITDSVITGNSSNANGGGGVRVRGDNDSTFSMVSSTVSDNDSHEYGGGLYLKSLADIKNVKVRVQATVTEDTLFPAYGAQIVHMPFGEVYTSLQTGVVECAENGYTVYMLNKHYEVAPTMSVTEHEANNSVLFVSDKVWSGLSAEQKQWVQTAADDMNKVQPAKAFEMEKESRARLEKIGVKIVTTVDKSGFEAVSKPIQDKLAKDLGPHAVKILDLVRNVK